ncbi:unnamed protein product [Trichobilharzia szidati]|nr:unnamed protein product [Trichobilharzia szidati]CAH8867315.1 unnamed protein product [Trichobilharzia szidati]
MNNVVLGSIILICNIMVCNVSANNYVLLSRFDKLCKERYDKGFLTSFVVDDITIREQLMLSWPGELNTPLENPKYAICPGLVIHPSGRFVKRAFPEGLALFWLLRASVRVTCPTNTDSTDSFYLQLDQWIDSLEWSTKHWRPDISKDHEEDVTGGSAGFGEAPDDILRVSCSSEFAGRTIDWSLSGYLRRIRLTWNFINETEVMHSNSTSSMENINLLNTSSSSSTSSASSTSLTTSDDVNSTLLSQRSHHHHHHEFRRTSGIQFLVRISSQMLFVGNFSMERKKSLCEFFSGFWCIQSPSSSAVAAGAVVGLNQTNSSTLGNPISSNSNNNNNPSLPDVVDQAICVQATMRCDNLPDCNLNVPINQMNLSQDEADCELITLINYQLGNASLKSYLSDKYDAWVSKLPWIVLAPVPAILICALIRICTQKRQLDLIEDHHLSMNCSIMHNNASGLDTDHCDKCQQLQYKRSRSNYFLIGSRKSRTGGGGGCGGGGSGVGVGAVGGGGLSMAFNSINKLSSVLEVEDEVDDADQQQQQEAEDEEEDENMLAMKILNVMTKSTTYSTAGLIDSTDDNKMLLKHAYSLPECDLKLSSSEQQGDEQSSDHRQLVDWFPPEDRKSACLSLINGKSLSKFNQQNPTVGDVIISNACCIETNRDNGRPTTGSRNIDDPIIHFNNELFVKCRSYNDLQQAMIQKEEEEDIQMACLSYSSHLDDDGDGDGDDEQMSSVCSSSSSSPTAVAAASSSSLSSPQVNLPGCETSRSSDIPASFVISSNPDLCIHSLSSPPASPSPSTSTVLSTLQKHLLQSKKYALNRIHHHHQFFMSSSYPVSKNDHRNNSTTTNNSSNSSRSKLLLMESAQSIEDNR